MHYELNRVYQSDFPFLAACFDVGRVFVVGASEVDLVVDVDSHVLPDVVLQEGVVGHDVVVSLIAPTVRFDAVGNHLIDVGRLITMQAEESCTVEAVADGGTLVDVELRTVAQAETAGIVVAAGRIVVGCGSTEDNGRKHTVVEETDLSRLMFGIESATEAHCLVDDGEAVRVLFFLRIVVNIFEVLIESDVESPIVRVLELSVGQSSAISSSPTLGWSLERLARSETLKRSNALLRCEGLKRSP